MAQSEFDDFCRFAFAFLDDRGTRYLVVGGLVSFGASKPATHRRFKTGHRLGGTGWNNPLMWTYWQVVRVQPVTV